MKKENVLRRMGSLLLGVLTFCPLAYSQSCSLCYTQAASSGSRMIEALRSGILILIVPPTLMWLVLAAIAYGKRNQHKRANNAVGYGADW